LCDLTQGSMKRNGKQSPAGGYALKVKLPSASAAELDWER